METCGALADPAIAPIAMEILADWPDPIPGIHRRSYDSGRVSLTLLFGDVGPMLDHLCALRPRPRCNGFFLDGFAPARNPDMWSPAVLDRLARLAAPDARLSTFTAARAVRDGLTAAGFAVEKAPGFGRKRHCLQAVFRNRSAEAPPTEDAKHRAGKPGQRFRQAAQAEDWTAMPPPLPSGSRVLIIGGGIAGCAAADALHRAGLNPILLEQHSRIANEGSGNPVGLLMPRPVMEPNAGERFLMAAYLHAATTLDRLADETPDLWAGPRGILAPPGDDDGRARARHRRLGAASPWPETHLRRATIEDLEAGLGPDAHTARSQEALAAGEILVFPSAGCIRPQIVCRALLGSHVTRLSTPIRALRRAPGSGLWRALDADGRLLVDAPAVVLACGPFLSGLDLPTDDTAPLIPVQQTSRGQLSIMPDTEDLSTGCDTTSYARHMAVAFGAYVSPFNTLAGQRVLGASYGPVSDPLDRPEWEPSRTASHRWCLNKLSQWMPGLTALWSNTPARHRVALRAETPDRVPAIGPLPEHTGFLAANADLRRDARYGHSGPGPATGLWMLGGLGSRGFQTATLGAALLADLMTGMPPPLDHQQIKSLHPARFAIRALSRNHTMDI